MKTIDDEQRKTWNMHIIIIIIIIIIIFAKYFFAPLAIEDLCVA